jgi:hypothetical protein
MLAIFIFRNKSRYVLLSSDSVGFIGTKSIPQIGQDPGPSCIISGCMGQVYMALVDTKSGALPNPFRKQDNRLLCHIL